ETAGCHSGAGLHSKAASQCPKTGGFALAPQTMCSPRQVILWVCDQFALFDRHTILDHCPNRLVGWGSGEPLPVSVTHDEQLGVSSADHGGGKRRLGIGGGTNDQFIGPYQQANRAA